MLDRKELMKKGASLFLKKIISQLSSITKSKTLAIKSKVESMKARLIICSLLKNKSTKLPAALTTLRTAGSISRKIHALLLGASLEEDNTHCQQHVDNDLQLVLHKAAGGSLLGYDGYAAADDEDNKYPDLRHSLFDQDQDASVIDLVKNSMEDDGEDFSLEDEIDHVADLFIMKFHKRMRLQKLESFKRYQDMLERSS